MITRSDYTINDNFYGARMVLRETEPVSLEAATAACEGEYFLRVGWARWHRKKQGLGSEGATGR